MSTGVPNEPLFLMNSFSPSVSPFVPSAMSSHIFPSFRLSAIQLFQFLVSCSGLTLYRITFSVKAERNKGKIVVSNRGLRRAWFGVGSDF